MNQHPSSGPSEDAEQLRIAAADWFARMRGPAAAEHRVAFDQWLAASPRHRATYNRIGEVFSLGKMLRPETPTTRTQAQPRAHWKLIAAGATAIGLVAGMTLLIELRLGPSPAAIAGLTREQPAASVFGQLQTGVGQIHGFQLADGSTVTLDSNALVAVHYSSTERRLRVVHGRARFDVVHDGRLFTVAAGAMLVTARGTLFDVSYDKTNKASVDLLRGAIDVSGQAAGRSWVRRMRPDQALAFSSAEKEPMPLPLAVGDRTWPAGRSEFDGSRLADVLARANSYTNVPIVAETPDVADLLVSGTFRIDDPEKLAMRLATLFDLDVDRSVPGRVVLRHRVITR